ncbi:MAG: hypothetical protein LBG82_03495 [Clostridiales Family XIII bacterium]|nr:hypothetical protein [Clostridiales Family XIII bacterium]
MTSTIILNRLKEINVRKRTVTKGDGYKINDVKAPKDSDLTKSLVNYFQASFLYIHELPLEYKDSNESAKLKNGFAFLVNSAKKNTILLDFETDKLIKVGKGSNKYLRHAIIIKDCKEKPKGILKKYYHLSVYDPNAPSNKTTIRISADFQSLKWSENWFESLFGDSFDYGTVTKIRVFDNLGMLEWLYN